MDSFQQIIFKLKTILGGARLHHSGTVRRRSRRRHHVRRRPSCACSVPSLTASPTCSPAAGRPTAATARIRIASTSTQQLQVILKPSPDDVIEQYLGSLEAIGIDLRKHDIKFEEDNWEAPTLGAWGVGWQVMLDGLEITQFTYFQQCGGIDLDLVPAELTYGLERLTAFLQVKDSVYDIEWAPQVHATRDVRFRTSCSIRSTTSRWPTSTRCGSCSTCTSRKPRGCWKLYPKSTEKARFPLLPTYDQVLKCSNLFNTLDARGAISVTERVGVIAARAQAGGGRGAGVGGSADAEQEAVA